MAGRTPPIPDHPTLADCIERSKLVEHVAEQLSGCRPPQVFGVHGDWGAGKSSFLSQLRYHLAGDVSPNQDGEAKVEKGRYKDHIVTVWFEAWRYQHEAVPIVALIQEIRRQFPLAENVKGKIAKIGEVSIRSLLNSLDDAAKLIGLEASPISAQRIQEIGEQWEKDHLAQRLATDSLQEHLTKVIQQLLRALSHKNPEVRLVVLIDDLDRCGSEAAYRLLEGLKIYLNLPNCVFVLGMNQQAVVDAVARNLPGARDKNEGELRLRAEAYLEKLCSVIWRLPLPTSPKKLLLEWIVEAPELRTALDTALTNDDAKKTEIRCLPPNPRRLKALANLLCRFQAAGAPINNKQEARCLLIVAYVYQFHADLFHRWQYDPDFFEEMRAWLRNGGFDDHQINKTPYFEHLTLPIAAFTDKSQAEVQLVWRSRFPDPGASEVFWIAPLLTDETLQSDDFTPYLERGNV